MKRISPEQRLAADPERSVWVSANAGSGKTSVLTSRVVRLLLAGADPARILCVTYTKAAAANMQNSIFKALAAWVALDDVALAAAIAEQTGKEPREGDIDTARRLFARAVETPGGLKIQTIHGFCERLLHLFPFEAAVPARFEVLDDIAQSEITETAISEVLNAALAAPESAMGHALSIATAASSEDGFHDALRAFMSHRSRMEPQSPETKFAQSPVRALLDLCPGQTVASTEREILEGGVYAGEWRAIVAWLKVSKGKRDRDMADALTDSYVGQGHHDLDGYVKIFLTDELKPRSDNGHFVSNDMRKKEPGLLDTMLKERQRVFDLMKRLALIATAERTEAIVMLADAVNTLYQREKRRLGRLDFPDLINKVEKLLTTDTARWVLYKLDQGLDHVLVDEAQDTSPQQWTIVKAIADDFFAGEGARGLAQRTVFAVGDEKQSIFGFQGAKPDEFDAARHYFAGRIKDFNQERQHTHPFDDVPLRVSYRTVDDVLKAVDQVFSLPEHFAGLDSRNERTIHESNRMDEPGLVELWPTIVGTSAPVRNAADAVDSIPEDAPAIKLAKSVAARVAHWTKSGARFENDGESITPGDVLVLVRSRGAIFDGVIKALKAHGVPVAGADRMKLGEQLAVMDLLALGRFCLLPEDDLTLAVVLKSPLVGLSEEDLLLLSHGRGKTSLWSAFQEKAPGKVVFERALATLKNWQSCARRLDPYHFYMRILSLDGGRRKLIARLGPDTEEAITVFLSQLRQWQAKHPPSLLGFIEAMARSQTDVKRDMEEAHGRVRVMTVHASKGLEARIVFLIDLFHAPAGTKGARLVELDPGNPDSAVWSPNKNLDAGPVVLAKESLDALALAESRRLLYVAMTRARDRLYLAGAHGTNTPPQQNWHSLISAALTDHDSMAEVPDETAHGTVHRWITQKRRPLPVAKVSPPAVIAALPDWLHKRAEANLPRPPPIRPSRISDAAEPPALRDNIGSRAEARMRGDLIHHLLQHLPDVDENRRDAMAHALAKAKFPLLGQEQVQEAIFSTLTLLNDPECQVLFSGEARAEVDIAGRVVIDGKSVEVAGRIDRIAITEKAVMLVDYKTGRPPRDIHSVSNTHLEQLAVYEALLRDLYPDRVITTAIIWTALPKLVILNAESLQEAMQSISLKVS